MILSFGIKNESYPSGTNCQQKKLWMHLLTAPQTFTLSLFSLSEALSKLSLQILIALIITAGHFLKS